MCEFIQRFIADSYNVGVYITMGRLVRCKDCIQADYAGIPKSRIYCMRYGTYFEENDYCSYGRMPLPEPEPYKESE